MLDSLRSATQTWVAKVLLGILVLSFAVWGIADMFRLDTMGTAALSAGGSSVTPAEYRMAYEQEMMRTSRQFGQRLTREQAQAIGVDNRVIAQLAAGVVLDEEARQMNLGISKDGIARMIAKDPTFAGFNGQFSATQFDSLLRQAGIRPQDYIESREQAARRQQIADAIVEGLETPTLIQKAQALFEGESRTIDYITLQAQKANEIADPSDEVLAAYFEANKSDYSAPEYRKITYVKLEPSDISDPASITQQEISDYYEKNKSRYTTNEVREIQQLNFATPEEAQAARDKVSAGTSFADLAKELNKTEADITLGKMEKTAIPDATIADAAFALEENQVSDVVQSAFGPILLKVTRIEAASVQPLEAVQDSIRSTLAIGLAANNITAVHDQLEEERSNGLTLSQSAEKLHLKPVTIAAIDAEGNDKSGSKVNGLPLEQQLIAAAFDTDAGFENDALPLGNTGYLWYEVDSVEPARDRELSEVKDEVIAAWKGGEAARLLIEKAKTYQAKLANGATLDAVAEELGVEKNTKRGITRLANDIELGSNAVAQIFNGPNGHTGIASTASGDGQIIFTVTETIDPASAGPESFSAERKQQMNEALSDDFLDQLVAQLQKQYPVKINRAVIDSAMAF